MECKDSYLKPVKDFNIMLLNVKRLSEIKLQQNKNLL